MIDTGIDDTHEDLKDTLWVNTDEIPGNGLDDDGNGYADDVNGWNFYHNNNQIYNGSEDSHAVFTSVFFRNSTSVYLPTTSSREVATLSSMPEAPLV